MGSGIDAATQHLMYARMRGLAMHERVMYLGDKKQASDLGLRTSDSQRHLNWCGADTLVFRL